MVPKHPATFKKLNIFYDLAFQLKQKIFFVSAETINQIFFMRGSLGYWVTMLCTPLIPNQVPLKINSAANHFCLTYHN